MAAHNYYQVGGSLKYGHPTYVERQADQDIYEGLKNREFCYVLNSRQMGKSSLRVQAMKTLSREGIKCASVDIGKLGNSTTPEKWYGGFISELWRGFGLLTEVNEYDWWHRHEHLSPILRISRFIEDILLIRFSENIVIFIDEIDSILKVSFKDDFFAFIRTCYNQRVDRPEYERLTFCLLGVATPSSLIQEKTRTPFNVGRAIELTGFTLSEAKLSLIKGLEETVENPEGVLEEVLKWTGGQPFLTQKLCQLIAKKADSKVPNIQQLVQKYIISNWETQDEPEHLRTIRDRLLNNEQRAARLLGLYQQILQKSEVLADGSSQQMELRLSGLVVKQQSSLKIYNRIYADVFDQKWVHKALADLRPYSEMFTAWLASHCQDESRLLRGQALREAQAWAADKSLSNLDYQFLTASLELEKREAQTALKAEKEASWILSEANQKLIEAQHEANQKLIGAQRKAKRIIQSAIAVLVIILLVTATVVRLADNSVKKAEEQRKSAEIGALNAASKLFWRSNNQLEALTASLKASQLLEIEVPPEIKNQTVEQLKQILYEVQERNRLEGHTGDVLNISFSHDGKKIATASRDGTAKLWTTDGQLLKTFSGHKNWVYGVSFSPNGKTIATASRDGTAKLWTTDGQLLKTFIGHSLAVHGVSFSPDGKTIATASRDGTAKLWTTDGQLLKTFIGHKNWVYGVSFSPNGKTIATASRDGTAKLWTTNGQLLQTFKGDKKKVLSISFSPNSEMIATAGINGTVKLWTTDGQLLETFSGHNDLIWNVNFSPDGKTIATASADGTAKLWTTDGQLLQTFNGHSLAVHDVSFSPDGKTIATASADGTAKLWSTDIDRFTFLKGHKGWVFHANFSPNGNMIATASRDGTAKLWSINGKLLHTLEGHKDRVYKVRFSRDGKTIATASWDGTVKLWNFEGQLLQTLSGDKNGVNSVDLSFDGSIIAIANKNNTVKVWNLKSKNFLILKGHIDEVWDVSFSPNNKTIITASADGTAKLWTTDNQLLRTFKSHFFSIYSVSFSPDGKTFATASRDGTAKLWTTDGQLLHTFKGHIQEVFSVSFSPDGKSIVTASFDNTVKLWSTDGQLLQTFDGHSRGVISASFSLDGKTIAICNKDSTVTIKKLLDDNLSQLKVVSCQWLKNYLKNNQYVEASDRSLCN
ncbi:AAA-like domain-containing protein [Nostoc sp. FACHB-892]|uniref:WD40 domain-containing protein n=1 Tax=Nostoc sp. FACHB-892 TaxID=2692843 RepID=UPI0016853D9E|nr:AAA-like domain-containing protein [Nostoc sp. FACHB-892]MBD2731298.1 AAA-like domain-containing protein [Nostoc sp. FACHB-892]